MNKYHFIGIGGIGMSALANMLLEKQRAVTGSDLAHNQQVKNLQKNGALVNQGHSAEYVEQGQTVIYSSAIRPTHPEYCAAVNLNCPILHRSELLDYLMQGYTNLAVTGSHGKTTTSSLLTHVLMHAGCDPSYALGGLLEGKNGHFGEGEYFVFEADESDGTFETYQPHYAIVTNLEPEHLENYEGSFDNLQKACQRFCKKVSKQLFYCGDDPTLSQYGLGISYGFGPQCQVRILNTENQGFGQKILLRDLQGCLHTWTLNLIGQHNACNAAGVFALAQHLGIDATVIAQAMATFPGVARRMHKRAEKHHVLMLDDYAHHPTEIKTTLEGLKEVSAERRLVVLFQPHRYTRTKALFNDFIHAFDAADQVFITDIYAASEEPIEGIHAQGLVEEIKKHSSLSCTYLPRQDWGQLNDFLRPHDVMISMGAGDVTNVHDQLDPRKKYRVGLCFGGKSCEHEVSIRSAKFVRESLNQDLYDVEAFFIDKDGKWGSEPDQPTYDLLDAQITKRLASCDVFFPVLHGPYGEDGTIQGLFEMLAKPYVGSDVTSAALSMNKMQSKILARSCGVLTPQAVSFTSREWKTQRQAWLEQAQTLTLPLFVKPLHLGSSVGITKVEVLEALASAIDHAFKFDTEIMVEEGVVHAREIEFAVMGNHDGFVIHVPHPAEKLAQGAFVDYDMKYSSKPVLMTVDTAFPPGVVEEGKKAAFNVYKAIGCNGMSRVDFLLDAQQRWWFFELNPIPGMTALSNFPKVWKRDGMSASELMDRLLILAWDKARGRQRHFRACLM